jgi:hypothetical protein
LSLVRNLISIAALSAATASFAAPIVQIGGTAVAGQGQTTSKTGVTILDFNVGSVTPAGVTITGTAGALVTNSVNSLYAAPPGDTSQYLAVGPLTSSPVTITLSSSANYIGFYAASLDSYNKITFFGTTTTSYTGEQLAALAGIAGGGSQTSGAYFNIFEQGNDFTKVELFSSQQALELDNFAIGRAAPAGVPLPGTLALFAVAGLGLAIRRKK